MPMDSNHIESDLRQLRPAAIEDSLLDRLDACAGGTWTELDPAEIAFEKQLRAIAPAKLPASLAASLEATLSGVGFPQVEKIVPFPRRDAAQPRRNRGWWSAAAVVALTGAISALLVPTNNNKGNTVAAPSINSAPIPSAGRPDRLIPAGFKSGVSEASDEGVIWQNNNRAHRVLKVVYTDLVTLKNANGTTYQVEQPRVEYILVPAHAD